MACGLALGVAARPAFASERLELGTLPTGATIAFVRDAGAEWGIEVRGGPAPGFAQAKPARLEVFQGVEDIRALAAGYRSVEKTADGVDASAVIRHGDGVEFRVRDTWRLAGDIASVRREIEVAGRAPGGFDSSIVFAIDPSVPWQDVACFAPGSLYGDPTFDGERSPGGTLNHAARRFVMREDLLPAPLFALSFPSGASVALLDPAPRGDSTVEETRLSAAVMIDARFQFGALGAWQHEDSPVEFGFRFPGTARMFTGGAAAQTPAKWFRRYHPIAPEVSHRYEVRFRFGANESFPEMTRNTWRWAWQTLAPAVPPINVEQMRRVLLDHLVAQAVTIEGRTGIPFVRSTVTDQWQWNWSMIAMGFVGKTLECADQLLREGDRDKTARGRHMRETGLAIISSLIKALPDVPLQATGYDLKTGQPWDHIWLAPWLRNATEDMRVLLQAWRRERALGREHPEWFAWIKQYVDWLIQQQRADGSFPRRWKAGSREIAEPTGTTSYAPVPLLVMMSEETGDPRYQQAAIRAAEYVWTNWGVRGLFIGGASDNPNITDKEAGMLGLEAFLSLYESTRETEWLERAQAAADFAETWMWIWNLPMPLDADDANLRWKRGVPTIGLQGITALHAGSADEYLDWSAPAYAKLHRYTQDPHYLEVARLLLHATKSMVALPGRLYDLKGPGWQQEGWRLGPGPSGRGGSGHRFWLPWITANHLHSITGLEEVDPALFDALSQDDDSEDANSGPRIAAVERLPHAVRLRFAHTQGGLVVKGKRLAGFSVRDEDGPWHPAYATLDGETVVVSSSAVPDPAAVRYAPPSNPDATLVNGAGLPAIPFETDEITVQTGN